MPMTSCPSPLLSAPWPVQHPVYPRPSQPATTAGLTPRPLRQQYFQGNSIHASWKVMTSRCNARCLLSEGKTTLLSQSKKQVCVLPRGSIEGSSMNTIEVIMHPASLLVPHWNLHPPLLGTLTSPRLDPTRT